MVIFHPSTSHAFDELTRRLTTNGGAVLSAILLSEGLFVGASHSVPGVSVPSACGLPVPRVNTESLIHHRLHPQDARPWAAEVLANRGIGQQLRIKSLSLRL